LSATRLELSPSWILAGAIVALHAAAAVSVLTVLNGFAGFSLATGLLLLGAAAAWSRALLGAAGSPRALELSGSEILLVLKDGRRVADELGERRHVSRFMVALPVRGPLRRTVLVTSDMLPAAEFRRLRLWALWGKLPPQPSRVAAAQLSA
jgi:hypothetical protein